MGDRPRRNARLNGGRGPFPTPTGSTAGPLVRGAENPPDLHGGTGSNPDFWHRGQTATPRQTWLGLPSREQSRSHYAPGTEFHIGKIEMVANTGTYLDSPFHRYANGKDLSELPLERLANLEGVVIPADLSKGRAVGRSTFKDHDLRGKAVLVRTGWDAHWRTDQYFEGNERQLPGGHLDPLRLAVLADALEDAGCTEADLLGHLRGPGPHARASWSIC